MQKLSATAQARPTPDLVRCSDQPVLRWGLVTLHVGSLAAADLVHAADGLVSGALLRRAPSLPTWTSQATLRRGPKPARRSAGPWPITAAGRSTGNQCGNRRPLGDDGAVTEGTAAGRPSDPGTVTMLYLCMEVAGCPTVCRHCWAQGTRYGVIPLADIKWVLDGAHRFCDNRGIAFDAYPMHELAAHPDAASLFGLFNSHSGTARGGSPAGRVPRRRRGRRPTC